MKNDLIISSSGIRGIVGQNLRPDFALRVGQAFGHFIGDGSIIVGGDTRPSHDMFKSAVISGLLSVGCDVIDIGKVPTPTCQHMIHKHKANAAVVITASHNPKIWNGIKLMNRSGSFLTAAEHQQFQDLLQSESVDCQPWDKVGCYSQDLDAIDTHIQTILSVIPSTDIQNAKLKVLLDPNAGAGCEANQKLLDLCGVDYHMLNAIGNGHFAHDPEPVQDNLSELITGMQNGDYDIGFAQDADADRLVIIDENGRFIGEDYSLAFCIDHILNMENQKDAHVVVNLSTSLVIESVAKSHGAHTHYSKIGETFVTEGLKAHQAIVGGEGNGGVIYPKVGWGRDSLLGIVIALDHLAKRKAPVSEIVSQYPQYVMAKEKFDLHSRDDISPLIEQIVNAFPGYPVNRDDGAKILLDNAWIHIRPSNTEPIIRLFIEARSQETLSNLLSQCKAAIQK